MIQKLQNLFHTDKWWGRTLFLILFYLLYFIIGYWVWYLFAKVGIVSSDIFIDRFIPAMSFLFLLPILSFFIVFKIRRVLDLKIKKIILFFVNLILILLNLFLFILSTFSFMQLNFF